MLVAHLHERMTKQGPTIDWTPMSGVQPVVYVGRDHDRPLGIIEMRPAPER